MKVNQNENTMGAELVLNQPNVERGGGVLLGIIWWNPRHSKVIFQPQIPSNS